MSRDAKRAGKLEKKLELLLGGYRKRASTLAGKCQAKQVSIRDKEIELACFAALEGSEQLARPQRLMAMESLVREQRVREQVLQLRFAELTRTRLTLLEQQREPRQ